MLFDIGVGFLLAVGLGVVTVHQPDITFTLLGAFGALAPDLDIPVWIIRTRGRIDEWMHRHRDLLHYPLILTPALFLVGWFFFDRTVGILLGSGTIAHFFHDSGQEGWGIRWLWPFDSRYYSFRKTKNGWKLLRWTRAEQNEVVRQHGDPYWWKEIYGSPRWRAKELLVFALGLTAAAAWFAFSK